MASTIRIKRSEVAGNPSVLAAGELAYSALINNGFNGGDRLYIGIGTETNGNAANHVVIGGKFFTDLLDHGKGTLTENSAIIVDADKKIDNLKVDNLDFDGNTISSLNTNGNILLDPNGSGYVQIVGTNSLVIPTGTNSQRGTGITGAIRLNTETSQFEGYAGSVWSSLGGVRSSDGQTYITAEAAPGANDNVIRFYTAGTPAMSLDTDSFDIEAKIANVHIYSTTASSSVSTGALIVDGGVGIAGAMHANTVNTDTANIGTLTITDNEISATQVNESISLKPTGSGVVSVNSTRITDLADPINAQDAATKLYVDEIAQGLSVKPAVRVATTADLGATYDNGTNGVGSTLTIPATATLNIDGITNWSVFDGILVKDQVNAFENGRYYISTIGNISENWVLTRCAKCDEPSEIPSMYIFVQEGLVYASTGWVATVEDFPNFDVGIDDILFTQFSGAGTYLPGSGLTLTGSTFAIDLDENDALEIVANKLRVKSSIAGVGLAYTNGVLSIGGTNNRIDINENSIDISSTYVGQTSITTLGTITSGEWNATTIGTIYGGTGITTYAIGDILFASAENTLTKLAAGAIGKVLQISASGIPEWNDIDGGIY
jgi:hypothetical protein